MSSKYHPPPPSSLPPRPPPAPSQAGGGRERERERERDREYRGGRSRNARSNRDQNRDQGRSSGGGGGGGPQPPRGDFSFRAEMPAGVQEAQQRGDYYGPRDQARDQSRRERERDWERDRRGGPPSGPRSQQQQQHGGGRRGGDRYGGRDHYSGNNSGNNNRRYGGRGGGGLSGTSFANLRFLAANRPILTQTQSADSYNGHGHGNGNGNGNGIMSHDFVKDNKAGTTYLNLDDLSDSDEAEMSMSGGDGGEGGAQPPRKRARVDKDDAAAAAAATPKWSNPDPYTVLPPTTETGSKKKDVVHLIRKARVKGERAAAVASEDTEEFISCGLDSDDDGVHDDGGGDAAAGAATDGRVVGAGEGSGSGGGRIGRSGRMANGVRDASAGGEGRPTNSKNKNATSLPNAANAVNTVNTVNTNNSRNPPAHAPVGPRAQQQRQSSLSVELNTSRKRTHDDELRPLLLPEHAILKKATKMPAGGVILPGWQVKPNEPPCPWLVVPAAADAADTVDTTHMGVWLHREMMDFYEFLRPRTFEQALRQALLDDLAGLVRRRFGNGRIHCFGSFMSGLYLPTGDMDIVMCSTQFLSNRPALFNSKKHLFKFGRFLCDSQLAEREHLEHITRAKVPLVKYIDTKTGLKVDVSFENMTGVAANETFARWKAQFPEMPLLVTLIKQLLTMRGLNEPVNGGIGGFSIICLVVSMLQLMPPVQTGAMTGENHLGDLLMHFLDLYGNKFNYETTAISLNPPGYTPKSKVRNFTYKNPDRLSIIDPNNPENDIAGGSKNTPAVMRVFSDAFDALQARMLALAKLPTDARAGKTILGVILEGDYSTYRHQREYLRELYTRQYKVVPSD